MPIRPFLPTLALALLAGVVGAVGTAAEGWAVFGTGLLLILSRHLLHLGQLLSWLDGRRPDLPADTGIWGEVFYRLRKHRGRNASEHTQAHAELEEMLQVASALPEGVVILDRDHRIAWLNDAASRHLGLSPQRDRTQFINYLLRDPRFNAWLNRADTGENFTLPAPALPGHILSLQLAPLPQGRKMVLTHDVTELIRLDEMRRDFVANVSHELRTPVTVIAGFLDTFADMPAPDPAGFRKHLGLMREQSERMRLLIDDLLALARLESEPAVSDDTVDMAALLTQLRDEAASLSQGRHTIDGRISLPDGVRGSYREIHSACMNLVSNAVRHTPPGGAITLRWEASPGTGAQFVVEDTGEGIEAQHLPRLTERFYRIDKGRSRASGGTGLGLAIVKRVLLRHQGRLKVDSVAGKGSRFAAVFPAERLLPMPPAPQRPDAPAAPPPTPA